MTKASGEQPVDRRRHVRLQKSLPIQIRLERSGERHNAQIVNIGAGGVLLHSDLAVSTNDLLTIELEVAGESQPISVYGTVVRNEARGVGVSFVRISEITSELIAYLIRKWEREGAPHS